MNLVTQDYACIEDVLLELTFSIAKMCMSYKNNRKESDQRLSYIFKTKRNNSDTIFPIGSELFLMTFDIIYPIMSHVYFNAV